MEVEGKVKVIGETKEYGSNGFRKREIVVTTDEQYPQDISIEFVQDKCNLLDKYKQGDGVKIGINLRGREWTDPQGEVKYFNSIQGWRIEDSGASATQVTKNEAFPPATDTNEEDRDDLPF